MQDRYEGIPNNCQKIYLYPLENLFMTASDYIFCDILRQFCHLLITSANSLDTNCLTGRWYSRNKFLKTITLEKNSEQQKKHNDRSITFGKYGLTFQAKCLLADDYQKYPHNCNPPPTPHPHNLLPC